MNTLKVTPKDFFLWVGAMLSLYVSVFSFIALFFEYINRAFPDALESYVDPYSGSIRFAVASLLVLFPTFLILMRFIRNDIAAVPEKSNLWVRRWVLFLTVFIAGATIVGDLITLVNTFLGGDVTTRFILKVLVVLLVAGAGFMHFLADIWGYWTQNPGKAKLIGYAAGVAVLASVIGGFFVIGSPNQVRLMRFDDQKVSDLTSIQYEIVNYWQTKSKLPAALADLSDPLRGFVVPKDPQTGDEYGYRVTKSPYSFELCADFNTDGATRTIGVKPIEPTAVSLENSNWTHQAGRTCFERTIDPERYAPYPKTPVR